MNMATKVTKKRPRRQIPNLCRICLTGSSSMSDILSEFLDADHNISILEALEKVMCCMVKITSSTPNHICSMCLSLLRISFNLKTQFEETEKKLFDELEQAQHEGQEYDSKYKGKNGFSKDTRREVEIIVGKENYSLRDILIVEEEEENYDFSQFLENLGKAITVEYLAKRTVSQCTDKIDSEKKNLAYSPKILTNNETSQSSNVLLNDQISTEMEMEEYETIVIQTVSDDEDTSFHWEHEYAKNTSKVNFEVTEIKKRGGRKSRYPESLMSKINSLIIEGDVQTFDMYDEKKEHEIGYDSLDEQKETSKEDESFENEKLRKRRRGTHSEMQEIEKYIICGTGENELNVQKQNVMNTSIVSQENYKNLNTPIEIDSSLMKDELVLEALNTKNICPQCSMAFATRIGLKRHLHYVHKRKDVLTRRPKGEKLSKEALIRRQIEKLKRKFRKNPMLCQICGFISKSPGGARYHSLTHGEKMYQCDLCPKKFYTPSHLKNHFNYKHEEKRSKHLCPLCGEYRNSATALSYHMKLHNNEERKFMCPICGIKFLVESAMTTHIRRHNGDRRFPCEICVKSFFSANELKKHTMIHTGERPFQCNYCEKRFVTPFNQKVHMMTHDGPFLCEYCHKGFIDMEMLNMHLKHKHRISATSLPKASQFDQEGNSNEAHILEGLNLLPPEEDNLDFEGD